MKKTLIASAIATATLSTTTFAMDQASDLAARLDSMPSVYGNIQLVYLNTEVDAGTKVTTNEFADNGSTIGFQHKHEIAPGIEGFLKAEMEFNAGAGKGSGNGLTKIDEAYFGAKGSFGSVQFGSDDTVFEWVNVVDISEAVGLSIDLPDSVADGVAGKESDIEAKNFQYYSPKIGGGLTIGVTVPVVGSEKSHAGIVAAKYESDMFNASLGYAMGGDVAGTEVGDSIGVGAVVKVQDLAIQLQFETKSADSAGGADVAGTEVMGYAVQGVYGLGSNQFALGYQSLDFDKVGTNNTIFVQALHNISDNMYAYVEYAMGTAESDTAGVADVDTNALAIGATYAF
jgi:predicted porin